MSDYAVSRAYVKRKRRKPPGPFFWWLALCLAWAGSFFGFALFSLMHGDTSPFNFFALLFQGSWMLYFLHHFLREYRKWRDDDE